jgi:hypothetical protein
VELEPPDHRMVEAVVARFADDDVVARPELAELRAVGRTPRRPASPAAGCRGRPRPRFRSRATLIAAILSQSCRRVRISGSRNVARISLAPGLHHRRDRGDQCVNREPVHVPVGNERRRRRLGPRGDQPLGVRRSLGLCAARAFRVSAGQGMQVRGGLLVQLQRVCEPIDDRGRTRP